MIAIKRRVAERIGHGIGGILCTFGLARMLVITAHHLTTWNAFWALFWATGLIEGSIREALRKTAEDGGRGD